MKTYRGNPTKASLSKVNEFPEALHIPTLLDVFVCREACDDEWFFAHCEARIKYLYEINVQVRSGINREPREHCAMWFNHWWKAYNLNKEKYKQRHPMELLTISN